MAMAAKERGFTLIELMVALTILLIGLLGLMGIVMVSLRASSFSRHGTEASVLAEDKLEELRTGTVSTGITTESSIDPQGNTGGISAIYTRTTTVATVNHPEIGDMLQIAVTVSWDEHEQGQTAGDLNHSVTLTTERMP